MHKFFFLFDVTTLKRRKIFVSFLQNLRRRYDQPKADDFGSFYAFLFVYGGGQTSTAEGKAEGKAGKNFNERVRECIPKAEGKS